MLKNYFKIAIAVLRRRKFFTFISLFGISFTLTILMVLTAFIDHLVSPSYPDTNRDRNLYVTSITLKNKKDHFFSRGPGSFYFFSEYVSKMKTPQRISLSSNFTTTNTYVNNKRLTISQSYTNEEFWNVLTYKFVEGKPYSKQHIDNAERVTVISEDLKNNCFGAEKAVGKYIEANNVQYRVLGVVKSVPTTMPFIFADMYLPYSVSKIDIHEKSLTGGFIAILQAKTAGNVPEMKKEYAQVTAKIPLEDKTYDEMLTFADDYLLNFTRPLFGGDNGSSGIGIFITVLSIFVLVFMLLPTLNLININISRIMERSSEIGVRKAFGASSATLIFQFIVENLILTFLGGFIGVVLSLVILSIINSSELVANMHLVLNINVLFYSFLACLLFGFVSGVYPAWRMSKMHVVKALKA